MTLSTEFTTGQPLDGAESCRVLGYGARLTGKKLAVILGTEGVVAAGTGIAVAVAGLHQATTTCGPPWFGSTPGWGGIRIGGGGVGWAVVVSAASLVVLGALLAVGAATAWRPPLDPRDRRVALTASLISGQPFVFVGMAIGLVLVLPVLTGNPTIGSAASGWRWFDQALLVVALVVGARVGWRACIAASTAPHRTQIIGGILVAAFLVFMAFEAAGVTRLAGGGLAPTVSPGSFLSRSPLLCLH